MKSKPKHITDRTLIFIILTIVGLLVAVLWYFRERLDILWAKSNQPISTEARQAIQNANLNLYQDGIADPIGKRVYFPGLGVYVPLSDKSQKLVYSFTAANRRTPAEAVFNAKPILLSYLRTWDDVPCLQRVAGASVNKPSQLNWAAETPVTTIKLSDGRTLYLYKNQMRNCRNFWVAISPNDIIDLLKQARPY